MKIGILTLPIKTNYGGILQAYALVRTLRKLGYDAWFIKRRWNNENQGILHLTVKWFYHKVIIRKFNAFIDKYIKPQTAVIDSKEKVRNLVQYDFDGYVVGSDQIWRICNVRGADYNYFLDFTNGQIVKRVAYAASFGVDYWDDDRDASETISEIRPYINQFDGVSVREDSGVGLCKSLFGVDALHVLDPTLLLSKEDYISNLGLKIKPKKYIAVYILDMDKDKQDIIDKISSILDLPVRYINKGCFAKIASRSNALDELLKPGVKSWLTAMGEAAFVITDSFHGMAFSINFEKQFVAIGNIERGLTRFTSLLDLFGLRVQLILKSEDLDRFDSNVCSIDYKKVNAIRQKLVKESINFLKRSLNE